MRNVHNIRCISVSRARAPRAPKTTDICRGTCYVTSRTVTQLRRPTVSRLVTRFLIYGKLSPTRRDETRRTASLRRRNDVSSVRARARDTLVKARSSRRRENGELVVNVNDRERERERDVRGIAASVPHRELWTLNSLRVVVARARIPCPRRTAEAFYRIFWILRLRYGFGSRRVSVFHYVDR